MIQPVVFWRLALIVVSAFLLGGGLTACGTSPKPKPQELVQVPSLAAKLVWQTSVGGVAPAQLLTVEQGRVALTNAKGEVQVFDLATGRLIWKFDARAPIESGAGFDGTRVAVITQANQLLMLQSGRLVWQVRLPARSYTPPLLAGGRVFVQLADRSVFALDGESGGLIWQLREASDPLVLQQPGLLTHANNKLLVGQGARLLRINPDDGNVEMQSTLAVARGINDLERLNDLIAPASLTQTRLCVVAFQTQLSCVNASTGTLLWSRATTSIVGVSGDATHLVNVQENGVVRLWDVQSNQMTWDSEVLKFRLLKTPILTPNRVWLADETAVLYSLDRQDGQLKGRLVTGLGALAAGPVVTPKGLLFLSQNGQLRLYEGL